MTTEQQTIKVDQNLINSQILTASTPMRISYSIPILITTASLSTPPAHSLSPQPSPLINQHNGMFGVSTTALNLSKLTAPEQPATPANRDSFNALQKSIDRLATDKDTISNIKSSLIKNGYAELPMLPTCKKDLLSFLNHQGKEHAYISFSNIIPIKEALLSTSLKALFSSIVGKEAAEGVNVDLHIRSFINKNPSSREWHADHCELQLRMIFPLVGDATQFLSPDVTEAHLTRHFLMKGMPDTKYVGTVPAEKIKSIPEQCALIYASENNDHKRGLLAECPPLPHRTPPPPSQQPEDLKRAFLVIDFT